MSQGLAILSQMIVPVVVVCIILYGMLRKVSVFDVFLEGVQKGFQTVMHILPTLVGLMVGVGVLRSSGFLDLLGEGVGRVLSWTRIPTDIIPLALVKMFSSSAATSLLLDIYKTHGVDSGIGEIASVMLSSTETIFYTVTIYFAAAKVSKVRWTIVGALLASVAGILASVLLFWH